MSTGRPPAPPAQAPPAPAAAAPQPRCIESEQLLRGDPELLIRHAGRIYRLRRTRQGKLILTT